MTPAVVISSIALVFSGVSLWISFLYRKKDFYNQLLREQISAGYYIMETLLQLNDRYVKSYTQIVGMQMAKNISPAGEVPHPEKFCYIF